ncbi:MAG: family 43 glycosylhydrolase [Clostridia bacterium]|nr:family 43 glycosylhydrolase [Clostridia bacterium]
MKSVTKAIIAIALSLTCSFSAVVPCIAAEEYPYQTKDILVRDPYVVVYQGKYYMFGTGLARGRGYGVCTSRDLMHWSERKNVFTADSGFDGCADFWAPECHYYKGAFYLFATYRSEASGKRGVAVFRCDTPDGQYEMISDGHITPKDIDCIDGTLYIDKSGKPWIVYVNEWTSSPDGIGEMAACRLNDELTQRVGKPILLFRANGHIWTDSNITDGPFLYRTDSGELLLLWSNMDISGAYAVGCAISDNGEIDGNWIHQPDAVYKKDKLNPYDGGHAMLFHDLNGQLTMAIHSPNKSGNGRFETARFIPMTDTGVGVEAREVYESRNDIASLLKNRLYSVYYGFISMFRRIASLFSAVKSIGGNA